MRVPNCRGWDEKQNCRQPYRFLNETLSAEIRIPETGLYRWTLLPSSRPLHRGEKWTVTCVQADGPKQQKGFSLTRGQMLRVDWDLCDGPAPALEIVDGLSSRPGEKHVLVARNAPGPVRWDLDDDGSFDDAEGLAITAVFDSAGEHLVRARSGTSEASHSTTIEEPFPTRAWAGAKAWPAFYRSWGDNGKQWMASVTFAALGPDGSTFIWDFDRDGFDDGRGQIVSRSVFFKKTKKIKARVRVTTAGGASAVKTIQRTLRPKHRL